MGNGVMQVPWSRANALTPATFSDRSCTSPGKGKEGGGGGGYTYTWYINTNPSTNINTVTINNTNISTDNTSHKPTPPTTTENTNTNTHYHTTLNTNQQHYYIGTNTSNTDPNISISTSAISTKVTIFHTAPTPSPTPLLQPKPQPHYQPRHQPRTTQNKVASWSACVLLGFSMFLAKTEQIHLILAFTPKKTVVSHPSLTASISGLTASSSSSSFTARLGNRIFPNDSERASLVPPRVWSFLPAPVFQ